MGDRGLVAISDAYLPKLATLWLSFNHITAKGLEYFVRKDWSNLQKLHLAANRFGPQGA